MEENRVDQEESTQSETPPTQVDDALSQKRSSECDEPRKLQETENVWQAPDGEEDRSQENVMGRNKPDPADCLPLHLLSTDEEANPVSVSSHPSSTQSPPSEPCWYCLRSLDSEFHPQAPAQQNADPLSPETSSGQNVNYQTDPRPHFGVACSSHSTCSPLWGSEGPCWGHRNLEVADQMRTCPHCHLGLPRDTLRWHEAKCLLFEGLRNSKT